MGTDQPGIEHKPESQESLMNNESPDSLAGSAKWINNDGVEVENVFGFNNNAELINARAAMLGFLLLILTEFAFNGSAVTKSIFGIG